MGWKGSSKGLESPKLLQINEGECIENISEIIFMKYMKLQHYPYPCYSKP